MKKLNKIKGDIGEAQVYAYLKNLKYQILETNYRNKLGEIDIIATKGNKICFVEVKERSSTAFGLPGEAVDRRKQMKIAKTAQLYLLEKHKMDSEVSFCVVEVLDGNINLIENAFEV